MLTKKGSLLLIGASLIVAIGIIAPRQKTVTISIVGDIMLSRDVAVYLEKYGYDYPYENVKDLFLKDDFTLANLECPITTADKPAFKMDQFIFKADVENALALKNAGIDCLSLANNHTMDQSSEGLVDTIKALRDNDLAFIGAKEQADSDCHYIFEKYGIRIAFFAYSALPPEGLFYDVNDANVQYIGALDYSNLEADLKRVDSDFKIVYFHWGNEYLPYHSETQSLLAKKAIDYGADFVVGAHPHVLQDIEVYQDNYIYYSLGNFIFDKQIPPNTDQSMILQLTFNKRELMLIEEIPVIIKDAQVQLVNTPPIDSP